LDFTLWKASKPGEPSWESPWGAGRPGWHIECSAMVEKHLPLGADIHGGGTDLRFPHHENELAQSAGAHPDRTFVRAWAHHGMVTLVSGKMAKSLGNILDVERAVERHGPNALRMWFLQSHYSQPIDYSEEILEDKKRSYEHLSDLYSRISGSLASSELSEALAAELRKRFDAAMRDDFNTPDALATLFEVAGRAVQEISNRPAAARKFKSLEDALGEALTILGFDFAPTQWIELRGIASGEAFGYARLTVDPSQETSEPIPEKIQEKVDLRRQARRKKDWITADRLRDELWAEGWAVEDTPEGPIVSRR
ncbi:MAG: cysteine--tRNA ligase, partial [Actinomycetota bacterium]|nr:cysteine--tRNA ligase [Actinomycetota bacterium]